MYRCARISKPVGTPDIARSNTPLSAGSVSVHTRPGRRLNRSVRLCSVYYTHGEPPLRERRVSPIFPDRVSFYLSERVELSNTARLSFSATSPPPYVGPTTNALSPDRCTLRLENSRARLCTRGSPPDRSLSYQLSSISLPSNRPFLLSSAFRSPLRSRNRELPRSAGVGRAK